MKIAILTLVAVIITAVVFAQAPNQMTYQAVIRNSSKALAANTKIGMRTSVLQGSASGASVYIETQTPVTNVNGLVTIQIGAGTVVSGSFAAINWAAGPYFIKTETDPTGGTNYTVTATTQLLSVPYALYAGNSGPAGNNPGDMLYWNGRQWILVPVGLSGQVLTLVSTLKGPLPFWGGNSQPVFTTLAATAVSSSTAVTGLDVTALGDINGVKSGGVILSTSPITNENEVDSLLNVQNYYTNHSFSGTGRDTVLLTGLKAGTTYYAIGYAYNSVTTGLRKPALGNQVSFTTQSIITPPVIATLQVTAVTKAYATGGGDINNDGGGNITASGIVWGTSANPDTSLPTKTNNGSSVDTGSFSAAITGLAANTTYYVRAYAANSAGITYGRNVTFTTTNAVFYVGQPYQGGNIFYIDQTGEHGLIAAPANLGNNLVQWSTGRDSTDEISDTATAIGAGLANTNYIISANGSDAVAANLARNYNGGGYTDWYLPSLGELKQFLLPQNESFTNSFGQNFWSSSVDKAGPGVWSGNVQFTQIVPISTTISVRAVRSF